MNTEKTKKPLSKKAKILLGVIAVVLLLIIAELVWSNSYINVEGFEYKNETLPKAFDGVKIVSVTDYHNHGGAYEDRLIDKIKAQSPDYIFLCGDIIDSTFTDFDVLESFLKKCADIAPCYLCCGNHELRKSADELKEYADIAANAGVTLLDNSCATIERGGEKLTVIGTSYSLEATMLSDVLSVSSAERDAPLLWLHHFPEDHKEMSDAAAQLGFENSLMFCGHAHGGLIRIPFTDVALYAPGQGLLPKMTGGEYHNGESVMLLSRGCGNSGLSRRMFDPFEIVVCTLRSEDF